MHDTKEFRKEFDRLRGQINPGMTSDEAAGISQKFCELFDRYETEEVDEPRVTGMTVEEARREEPPAGDVRVVEGGRDASEIGGAAKSAEVSFGKDVHESHPTRRAADSKPVGQEPRIIRSPAENDMAHELAEVDPDNTLGAGKPEKRLPAKTTGRKLPASADVAGLEAADLDRDRDEV